ncbi:hypothetical protein Tco_0678768 [Tanacetum coccineum]|uniref:Uncharacterized protein n=1 Tax=Tanacetum coccineum TaxID=301880 RepID=A0ABQ4XFZ8_9ASTR
MVPDEVIYDINVFCSRMKNRVVGYGNGTGVVTKDGYYRAIGERWKIERVLEHKRRSSRKSTEFDINTPYHARQIRQGFVYQSLWKCNCEIQSCLQVLIDALNVSLIFEYEHVSFTATQLEW